MPRLLLTLLLVPALAQASAVDFHLHLRMDSSLPGIFRGHPTEEPVTLTDRKALFQNQVSLKDLEKANVRLVMASLYAPVIISQFQGGTHRALLRQIGKIEEWVTQHPQAVLVRSPEEAEAVLKSKEWRLGVIIAAEGGIGVDTPARIDTLWKRGLRMVTIAHFINTPWGGAADVRYGPFSNCVHGGKANLKRNPLGLTEKGKELVDLAVKTGLIVDLAHASDQTVSDVIARHPKLPLMFSHEGARELTPCERMISPEQLREVRRSKGMVGVTLGANYVDSDLETFLAHSQVIAREAGPEAVALGTDYNGFITRIKGAAGSEGYALALNALAEKKIPADKSAEAFVRFWRRTQALSGR